MKKTEWFPGWIKPARRGVYEAQLRLNDDPDERVIEIGYCEWDGMRWGSVYETAGQAENDPIAGFQNKCWRGLTTKDGK